MDLEEDHVIFGERLAEAAGKIIRDKFNKNRAVQYKDDGSPVTSADRDAETVMRDMIMVEYPKHGILGEENKSWQEESECLWVLDPIDGTRNFASGFYNFGTLIALVIGGRFALGIINQPVLKQRWVGVTGRGTVFNGKVIETRECSQLGEAWMCSTTPDMFKGSKETAYTKLSSIVRNTIFGSDCIGYGMLSCGKVDIVCEAQLKPWDFAAHIPIIEGSGGIITDWLGKKLTLESSGEVLATGSEKLHKQAVLALA